MLSEKLVLGAFHVRNHRVRNSLTTPSSYSLHPTSCPLHLPSGPLPDAISICGRTNFRAPYRFILSGFILLFHSHFWRSVWFFLRQMAPGFPWRPRRKYAATLALFRFFVSSLCSLLFCTLCYKPILHWSVIY